MFYFSLLLQIGTTDVNVRDNDGWTPLHAAVHWGSKTACELLTEAGANFDLKNNNVSLNIYLWLFQMILPNSSVYYILQLYIMYHDYPV